MVTPLLSPEQIERAIARGKLRWEDGWIVVARTHSRGSWKMIGVWHATHAQAILRARQEYDSGRAESTDVLPADSPFARDYVGQAQATFLP